MLKNVLLGILLVYILVLVYLDITPSESMYLLKTIPNWVKYQLNLYI